jgi:hypothetical protein
MALGLVAETTDHAESTGWQDPFRAAFDQLSEPEREVLRITAWEGLNTTEGATVLSCSVAAFKVRLHRARRHFRRLLDADGTNQVAGADEPQSDPSLRPQRRPPQADPLICSTAVGRMISIAKEIS